MRMSDDIVTQLNQLAATLDRGAGRSTVAAAAVEIDRLRAEVAQLERVGDDIARSLSTFGEFGDPGDKARLEAWKEARRG